MNVLLSIRPEFASLIFEGSKRYEYRKVLFSNEDVETIVVYASRPIQMIVGQITVDTVLADSPRTLWQKTGKHSGVSRAFFFKYFAGRKRGYAIKIKSANRYREPVDPHEIVEGFRAPQSFMYWGNAMGAAASSA